MTQDEFDELARTWKSDPMVMVDSSGENIMHNPAYLRILDEGVAVIPMIFKAYQKDEDPDWGRALEMILGFKYDDPNHPVQEKHNGDCYGIWQDWMRWGGKNGYL